MNKSVNNFVSNTIVNQASACSASITQLQKVDFSNMKVAGDFNLDGVEQNPPPCGDLRCSIPYPCKG